MHRIAIFIGARSEAIKMASVVAALEATSDFESLGRTENIRLIESLAT